MADVIGDPSLLLKKFEAVVNHVAEYEKDIPWLLEAQKISEGEAKTWTYEDHKRMRAEDDPKWKQVMAYDSFMSRLSVAIKFSSRYFAQAEARMLFLGILQQLDLPPKLRKSIEAAAAYHAKNRQSPKKDVALKAYMDMLTLVRGQLAAAKEALAHGQAKGESGEAPTPRGNRVGPFNVVNTGGFNDKVMAEAEAVVAKSAQLLQAKGLNRVLYGDVLISRTLSRANVLAFYLIEKDELFVRANLRGKANDAVLTVCHELGHRLQFKFLKSKDAEIKSIYAQIARKSSAGQRDRIQKVLEEHPITPGDTYVEKSKIYEVLGTGWTGTTKTVKLVDPEEQKIFREEGITKPMKTYSVPLELFLVAKGYITHHDLSGFITPYAKTSPSENFAEMISYWCVDKLPEDQVEMLQTVL